MNKTAIKIKNLSKKYEIGGDKRDDRLTSQLTKIFKKKQRGHNFNALCDINLEINKSEVVGILGKNGAGKSTLLKLISNITKPTSGTIELYGRVASLLEVGTGFHPELSGRENIFLNGTILGMSRQEVKEKINEIIDFSGVEKFIETPVKHYSSGMYVRLAFAVAAHLEPEILIVDEVLAVGDLEFQKKCLGKMKDVSNSGRTVIFVSHNLEAIRRLCNRAIVLENGIIKKDGTVNESINYYLTNNIKNKHIWESKINSADNEMCFISAKLTDNNDRDLNIISNNQILVLELKYKIFQKMNSMRIVCDIYNQDGLHILSTSNGYITNRKNQEKGTYISKLSLEDKLFNKGSYTMVLRFDIPQLKVLIKPFECINFEISELDYHQYGHLVKNEPKGILHTNFDWKNEICF